MNRREFIGALSNCLKDFQKGTNLWYCGKHLKSKMILIILDRALWGNVLVMLVDKKHPKELNKSRKYSTKT